LLIIDNKKIIFQNPKVEVWYVVGTGWVQVFSGYKFLYPYLYPLLKPAKNPWVTRTRAEH
jgi:hypothetical protein